VRSPVDGIVLGHVHRNVDAVRGDGVLARAGPRDPSRVLAPRRAPGKLRHEHLVAEIFSHLREFDSSLGAVLLRSLRALLERRHVHVLLLHDLDELLVLSLQLGAKLRELAGTRGGGATQRVAAGGAQPTVASVRRPRRRRMAGASRRPPSPSRGRDAPVGLPRGRLVPRLGRRAARDSDAHVGILLRRSLIRREGIRFLLRSHALLSLLALELLLALESLAQAFLLDL
jgi:hypothetical protein